MAKCKACADGSIECGPIDGDLCLSGGGWEPAGSFAFRLFVMKGPQGDCKIKVVPCIPTGSFRCTPLKCAPARIYGTVAKRRARTVAKRTVTRTAGKVAKKAARKSAKKAVKKTGRKVAKKAAGKTARKKAR